MESFNGTPGDSDVRVGSHRTRHRKEVKRYHQRQQSKQLREEAKARDAQLFLFEHSDSRSPSSEIRTSENHNRSAEEKTYAALMAVTGSAQADAALRSSLSPATSTLQPLLPVIPAAAARSSWSFDFLMRTTPSPAAISPPQPRRDVSPSETGARQAASRSLNLPETSASPTAAASTQQDDLTSPSTHHNALITVPCRSKALRHTERDAQAYPELPATPPISNSKRIGVLPIKGNSSSTITKLLMHTQVQRVEGVAAIPMIGPFPAGTDLNRPPRNYLTLDPVHNIHQHAPGFLRNQRVALQSMLAKALMEWRDLQQHALIVSSAEAMRTIFEQVYVPGRQLALRIRRIGPTLVIDSRASEPTQVWELREQALLGKALYLMKGTHGRSPEDNAVDGATPMERAELALTVPERRLTSTAASDVQFGAALHRYSQVLRWRIESTEVLVGVDAPIALDQRTNTEHLVRMKELAPTYSSDAEQRETLRSWFNAMLANVSHVGTYTHHEGVVQSHTVKRTTDMLGYVEARMAAAALSFTSRTLRWIATHCTHDGGTYAMVRDYTSSEYVELYELPDVDESTAFVEETGEHFGPTAAAALASANANAMAGQESEEVCEVAVPVAAPSECNRQAAFPRPQLFNWNFGRTCFNIGQHLFQGGDATRAVDALPLLHRSYRIFLPYCRSDPTARESVTELVRMVPVLIARKLYTEASYASAGASTSTGGKEGSNSGGGIVLSSPEIYRDALLLCGQFEVPLQHMLADARAREDDHVLSTFFARSLILCSASVCAVVALSLEAYHDSGHQLRALRKAQKSINAKVGNGAQGTGAKREGTVASITSAMQDLLQVIVEGLVRLEETSELVGALPTGVNATVGSTHASKMGNGSPGPLKGEEHTAGQPPVLSTTTEAPLLLCARMRGAPQAAAPTSTALSGTADVAAAISTSVAGSRAAPAVTETDAAAAEALSCAAVMDPRTQVDATPLKAALHELYGDVSLVAMTDVVGDFTVRVLTELCARMEARGQRSGHALPTTLRWLSTLKADAVSLSFTALRFYGRVGVQTRRHLTKLALVYYLVGREHRHTARYTKALEALHRSKSLLLLLASQKVPEDLVFGAAFGSPSMLPLADVMRLLGDVYRSVVDRKLETAVGTVVGTLAQPLMLGPLHALPDDADGFFTQALSAYTQGGPDVGCKVAKAETLVLYAAVLAERIAVSGVPATHATSQHIAQLLREAEELAPTSFVREREWHTLRLFTVSSAAAQDSALTRAVEEIVLRSSCDALSSQHSKWEREAEGHGAATVAVASPHATTSPWAEDDGPEGRGRCVARGVCGLPCSILLELQRALVCCVMVERDAPNRQVEARSIPPVPLQQPHPQPSAARAVATSEAKYRAMLRWIGRAAAYLTNAVEACIATQGNEQLSAAVRHQWHAMLQSWTEQQTGVLVHRLGSMIALRVLGASQSLLPGAKQQEARGVIRTLASALEEASATRTKGADSDASPVALLQGLRAALAPFVEW